MEIICMVIGISVLPAYIIFAWQRRKQRKLLEEMTLRGEEVDQEDPDWVRKRAALVFVGLAIALTIIIPNLSEDLQGYFGRLATYLMPALVTISVAAVVIIRRNFSSQFRCPSCGKLLSFRRTTNPVSGHDPVVFRCKHCSHEQGEHLAE